MKTIQRLCWLVLITTVGCPGGGNFDPEAQSAAAGITPRADWTCRGQGVDNPAAAIDGNMESRATTPSVSYRGATLTVDLGGPSLFNMVVIDHGSDPMGFAQRVAVSTSRNGESYTRCAIAPGNRRVTIVCIVTPVLARYVRIEAMQPGTRAWSVAEIQLK